MLILRRYNVIIIAEISLASVNIFYWYFYHTLQPSYKQDDNTNKKKGFNVDKLYIGYVWPLQSLDIWDRRFYLGLKGVLQNSLMILLKNTDSELYIKHISLA